VDQEKGSPARPVGGGGVVWVDRASDVPVWVDLEYMPFQHFFRGKFQLDYRAAQNENYGAVL
jgi:hypothetical protein